MSAAVHDRTTIASKADLSQRFQAIRAEATNAASRVELTRFYRDAEGLVALTYTPSWQNRFGESVEAMRRLAADEFTATARVINKQAEKIGAQPDYVETWGGQNRVYGEVSGESDLRQIFADIREGVAGADNRGDLTRLYRRAEYLITLTYAPAWRTKFGARVEALRRVAASEFTTTVRAINRRAAELGIAAYYDETWGDGR